MKPSGAILDRNLELLLKRAYVPALPRPEFRAQLLATCSAEIGRLGIDRRGARRRPATIHRGPRKAIAAVAAAAAVLFVAWFVLPSGPGADDAAVLLRRNDAEWTAATREELAGGVRHERGSLEVDARNAAARVLASGATVEVAASSRARIESSASGSRALLIAGRLRVEQVAGEWWLVTSEGRLRLERATLEASSGPDGVRVHLFSGAAWLGDVALEPGELLLRDGSVVAADPDRRVAGVDGADDGRRLAVPPDTGAQPPDEPAAEPTTSIAGVVRDAATKAPVTGFRVLLLAEGEVPETDEPLTRWFEDADGRFLWEGFPAGRFDVFVQAEGYAQLGLPAHDLAVGAPVEITADVETGGAVRGWVVDRASGNPVTGAWVISETAAPTKMITYQFEDGVPDWLPAWTTTGADGSFELPHVAAGTHVLRVSAPGYAPTWSEGVSVAAGRVADASVLALERGGSITGRVTGSNGAPLDRAFLLASPIDQLGARGGLFAFGHAETDETGRYEIVDLHPDVFMVFQWDSFEACQSGETPTLKPTGVGPGATAKLDFLGHDGGTRVFGRFLDPDGNPIANQKFSVMPRRNRGQIIEDMRASATNEDGAYAFVAPTAETWSVMLTHGMGTELVLCAEIDVPELTELELDVRVSRAGIRGTVTDGRNGEPVANALILIERVDDPQYGHTIAGKSFTDAEGRYSVSGLIPGVFVVHSATIEADLGFAASEEVIVQPGEAAPVADVALFPGGSLRVVVTDPDGNPVPGAIAELQGAAGHGPHGPSCCQDADTDQAGRETLGGIRPGEHRLRIRKPGFEEAEADVVVRAGEETLQEITLTPLEDS